jgi:hypothetical protein
LVAIGLGLVATPGFAQDTENYSQPLLTLTPAERSPSGGVNSGTTSAAKGEIDLNDPRVMAAISEAMDNPISELMAVWNQFDAIQVHFPRTPSTMNATSGPTDISSCRPFPCRWENAGIG